MLSNKEAVYYAGLMGGIVLGSMGMRALGIGGIASLIVGLVCGVALGFIAERAYTLSRPPPPPPQDGPDSAEPPVEIMRDRRGSPILSQVCPNPQCGWAGDNRGSRYCPLCGHEL